MTSGNKIKDTKEVSGKAKQRRSNSFISILNGSYFSRENVVNGLPFVLFLVGLTLVYIANGYYAEGTIRAINRTDMELKELRSEYITTKSELMYKSKQSQVAKTLNDYGLGVKESMEPPKKIIVEKTELR